MEVNLLIGCLVEHKTYGTGEIIEVPSGRLVVQFNRGRKLFVFPDAFDGYLRLKGNDKLEMQIDQELHVKQAVKDRKTKEINESYAVKRVSKGSIILLQVPFFNDFVCSQECMEHNVGKSTSPCYSTACRRLKAKKEKKLGYSEIAYGLEDGRYECLGQTFEEQHMLNFPDTTRLSAGQAVIFVAVTPKSETQDLTVYGCGSISKVLRGDGVAKVYFNDDTFVLLNEDESSGIPCNNIIDIKERVLFTGKTRKIATADGIKLLLRIADNLEAESERAEAVNTLISNLNN